MPYDNRGYWTKLHEMYRGELKAVGHPFLSENLNRLLYQSQTDSLSQVLSDFSGALERRGVREFSLLDVGAGTGYWSNYVISRFSDYTVRATALDLSEEALKIIRVRNPEITLVQENLASIAPDAFLESFDLVLSCYCLHHLVNLGDFINALRFSACSVKRGGFLLIMDPILSLPYSRNDTMDFESFRGNGIPRHLYVLDDILGKAGLQRRIVRPAASFILNENIESYGPASYYLMTGLWKLLCRFYRSERFVQVCGGFLRQIDGVLKRSSLSFSSSICLYEKS